MPNHQAACKLCIEIFMLQSTERVLIKPFLVFTSAVKDLCYHIKLISILFQNIKQQICRPQSVIQLLAGFHASIWHIFRSHLLDSRIQLCIEMLQLRFILWQCILVTLLSKNDFVSLDLHTHYSLTPNPSDSSEIHLLYVGFPALIFH